MWPGAGSNRRPSDFQGYGLSIQNRPCVSLNCNDGQPRPRQNAHERRGMRPRLRPATASPRHPSGHAPHDESLGTRRCGPPRSTRRKLLRRALTLLALVLVLRDRPRGSWSGPRPRVVLRPRVVRGRPRMPSGRPGHENHQEASLARTPRRRAVHQPLQTFGRATSYSPSRAGESCILRKPRHTLAGAGPTAVRREIADSSSTGRLGMAVQCSARRS